MTRFPAASAPNVLPRLARLLATSCAAAIAFAACPDIAHAQFNGKPSNDLTAQNSTDLTQINNTPLPADTTSGDGNGNASTRLRQTRSTGARDSQPEPQLVIPRQPYAPGRVRTLCATTARRCDRSPVRRQPGDRRRDRLGHAGSAALGAGRLHHPSGRRDRADDLGHRRRRPATDSRSRRAHLRAARGCDQRGRTAQR